MVSIPLKSGRFVILSLKCFKDFNISFNPLKIGSVCNDVKDEHTLALIRFQSP